MQLECQLGPSLDELQHLHRVKLKLSQLQSPDSLNSQSDCECAICGEHYGDRSATWIQCNICDDWFDLKCAGASDEQLQEEYLCDLCAPC